MKLATALAAGSLAAAFAIVPAVAASAAPAPSPSSTDYSSPPAGTGSPTASPSAPGSLNEVGALYSETTVRGPQGDSVVVNAQWGKVTAVSDTSLSVQSADGTTWDWKVDDKTKVGVGDQKLDGVKTGHSVAVGGVKSGEERTATYVGDPVATLDKVITEAKGE